MSNQPLNVVIKINPLLAEVTPTLPILIHIYFSYVEEILSHKYPLAYPTSLEEVVYPGTYGLKAT